MIKIGSFYNSNNYGRFKVVSRGSKYDYYTVIFENTGTIKEFRSYQIKEGCVRDPYAKSVCGVGCTGDIKTKGKYKPYYSIWHDMINRCYNENDKRYKGEGVVTVCHSWLTFENFYNEIKNVDGFDDEKIRRGELVLDKDSRQRYSKYKFYSPETCVWISKQANTDIQDSQQKPFCAISPEGEIFNDYNLKRFCREHSLNRNSVRRVLRGDARHIHGWQFQYKSIK